MRISDWSSDVCSSDLKDKSMTVHRPGEKKADPASMLRVNQAGEFGATRIYAGQMAILGDRHPMARSVARMAAQEEQHRIHLDRMITRRGVRPTLLADRKSVVEGKRVSVRVDIGG